MAKASICLRKNRIYRVPENPAWNDSGFISPVDERKLQWSAGFDVLERLRQLRQFYRRAGLNDEADWIEQRMRFIEAGKPARDTP